MKDAINPTAKDLDNALVPPTATDDAELNYSSDSSNSSGSRCTTPTPLGDEDLALLTGEGYSTAPSTPVRVTTAQQPPSTPEHIRPHSPEADRCTTPELDSFITPPRRLVPGYSHALQATPCAKKLLTSVPSADSELFNLIEAINTSGVTNQHAARLVGETRKTLLSVVRCIYYMTVDRGDLSSADSGDFQLHPAATVRMEQAEQRTIKGKSHTPKAQGIINQLETAEKKLVAILNAFEKTKDSAPTEEFIQAIDKLLTYFRGHKNVLEQAIQAGSNSTPVLSTGLSAEAKKCLDSWHDSEFADENPSDVFGSTAPFRGSLLARFNAIPAATAASPVAPRQAPPPQGQRQVFVTTAPGTPLYTYSSGEQASMLALVTADARKKRTP